MYGWWDRKGKPRSLGWFSSQDAPLYNDSWKVRACQREVFDYVNTWCVPFGSDQAATNPWDMYKGYKWGTIDRGVGIQLFYNWGVPYLSGSPRSRARSSIANGYPSIIGIGFYSHYPVAYGYKKRKWKAFCATVFTQTYFKCNMGWGGSSPVWKNGDSVWYGQQFRVF
jgi:hypothetical protein